MLYGQETRQVPVTEVRGNDFGLDVKRLMVPGQGRQRFEIRGEGQRWVTVVVEVLGVLQGLAQQVIRRMN